MQISGSKAEGLDMKGSDTDIMVLIGNAYENNGENLTRNIRRASTMNSLPRWYDRYMSRLFDSI
jgi:hypothetical protein